MRHCNCGCPGCEGGHGQHCNGEYCQSSSGVAVSVSGKLYRIRQLLDKRAMDPHLRQEFIAAIEHGEGCGCYYCLGPRPGISPPPLEITD